MTQAIIVSIALKCKEKYNISKRHTRRDVKLCQTKMEMWTLMNKNYSGPSSLREDNALLSHFLRVSVFASRVPQTEREQAASAFFLQAGRTVGDMRSVLLCGVY